MKVAAVAWLVCFFVALSASAPAQELGGGESKYNLDLPLDALGEVGEGDEDPPEVVTFYGQTMEGDGFFYVVDRSGSMMDSGELARAKQEITRNITEISSKTEFAVVFFDMNVTKFPSSGRPVEASPGMKGAAIAFISPVSGGYGSCMAKGLQEGMQFANLAMAKRKVMVYVGDGGGTCGGGDEATYLRNMVAQITAMNYQRVQINCIGVLMGTRRGMQEGYMKQLAAANGGTYRRID